jgi:hypothetical protein
VGACDVAAQPGLTGAYNSAKWEEAAGLLIQFSGLLFTQFSLEFRIDEQDLDAADTEVVVSWEASFSDSSDIKVVRETTKTSYSLLVGT